MTPRQLTALALATIAFTLALTDVVRGNGRQFFPPASGKSVNLVYFGRIKDKSTGRLIRDRAFLTIFDNASDMMLVESTIVLAHGLGRRVIAEGIEDPETLSLLRAIGCDIAQGYYLAKPMQLDALITLLANEATIRAA